MGTESGLISALDWLAADQYSYGEWGRCESTDPTAEPRTFEISTLKPNFFISSQAALALRATSAQYGSNLDSFFRWLDELRDTSSGFWTSAGGALVPFGNKRGWSAIKNIRHTAKALDLLFLADKFTSGDAPVLQNVLEYQMGNGAFPQVPDGPSDIWSTAYVVNMIIRAKQLEHLKKSVPRGRSEDSWSSTLTTHLDRARAWLCSNISNGLWSVSDKDPIWMSEAVLAEIGADLALHRPDVAAEAAQAILRSDSPRRGLTYWSLLLVFSALPEQLQTQVKTLLSSWTEINVVENTYDMACSLRAFFLKNHLSLIDDLRRQSDGHESLMTKWTSWDTEMTQSRKEKLSRDRNALANSVDIAVITIREDEFEAILRKFIPCKYITGKRRTYDICEFKDINNKSYEVAVLRAHEQGHGSAQSATSDVISDLDPKWIMVVGIAGGVPEHEFCLGDVVVATRVIDFSVTAAQSNGSTETASRGGPAHKSVQDIAARLPALKESLGRWNSAESIETPRPSIQIKNNLLIGDTDWKRKVQSVLCHHFGTDGSKTREPIVTSAPIVSANKLLKDPELLQKWLIHARDLKAVEMELPGVYEAARDVNGDKPVIAVRGISDIVGYKRGPEWTAYACSTAASFAHALVRGGLLSIP
ncbi:hypothetical protein M1B72_07115 [Geomonas paludis]|uniref:Nucleoside phosphorylase domain-containing protein n=1 Tax=Geomonas paludis TaxID=2740185 RepID=A0ABY4LL10_9BACT|nr:hypothetical protein [Geomonas paludis]UPU37468.1 hypothetical protein M1B72_07115 [Geomonas paludis]